GERLGQLRRAHAGRPLDEDGASHALRQIDDGGAPSARDVPRVLEALLDVLDRVEHGVPLTRRMGGECRYIVAAVRRRVCRPRRLCTIAAWPLPSPAIIACSCCSG